MAEKSSHKKLTIKLVLATFAMFGFGFALVPLYDVMCDALGINGKTSDVAAIQPTGMQPDLSRTIRVEFMAHVNPDMPWEFKPKVISMNVHPGEVVQTEYLAFNESGQRLVGHGAFRFSRQRCSLLQQNRVLLFYATAAGWKAARSDAIDFLY